MIDGADMRIYKNNILEDPIKMTTFKKMRSLMAILALVVCVALAFASCGPKTPPEEPKCECVDANSDHNCDKCGTALTECSNENGDHNCDVCEKVLSECADADKDHKCDVCGKTASECADTDKDHYCDVCNKSLGDCVDANKDHKCDVCGIVNSSCYDGDKDHVCNHCGGNVGGECADGEDEDHNCDYCGKSLCVDEDKDDYCDECGKCYCVDEDADCICDTCGVSVCADVNPLDHYCDVCNKLFSECADGKEDGNHDCDICYKSLCADGDDAGCDCDVCGASLCVDGDNNHACDNCAALLCYDTSDRGHNCDVCNKNLCVDGEDDDHNCDKCGDILCYDTDSNGQCEICGSIVPTIIVYAEGTNCKVNGADFVSFIGNEENISIVPSYYASEYVIDFWIVYDNSNNPVVIIENGDAFAPAAAGRYYIVPVFVANNLSGVTDAEVDINMSDAFETGQKDNEGTKEPWDHEVIEDEYVLGASWANVNLDQKLRIPVAGSLNSVGAYKAGSMQIAAEPGNAANAVLIWATSCNTSTGGFGNAIATFGIDADSVGDNYTVEFDYYLDHTYSNSDPGLEFFVTDGTNKYFIGRINQAKQFAGHKDGATNVPLENAATLISRNVDNNKTGCLSVKIYSDTWYSIRLVIEDHKVALSYSLRGTNEWTLLDTQDFSKVELSAKTLTAFGFQAGYYNNNSILMLDNIWFGRGHDCLDADNNHNCDVCNTPLCYDGIDADHNCDRCDANLCSEGDIADHYCDCGAKLSECADEDKTHYCDICGKGGFGGECADAGDEGHDCDYCGKNLCTDPDFNHICNECNAVLSVCADADKNHICDYCNAVLSDCTDENTDHKCDYCKGEVAMDKHVDVDGDGNHVCDYGCGATLNEHVDANTDFACDECAIPLCHDTDANHVCDITSEHECAWVVTDHVDEDKNHDCDFTGCNEVIGEHADSAEDADHVCDHGCGAVLSECADNDKNHLCDVCNKIISYCADTNADHKCEVCAKEGVCTDANADRICDNCGNVVAYNFEVGSIVTSGTLDVMTSVSSGNRPAADKSNVTSSTTITTNGRPEGYTYATYMSLGIDPKNAANQVLSFNTNRVEGGGANAPTYATATPVITDTNGTYTVMKFRMYIGNVSGSAKAYHDVLYLKMYDAAGKEKKLIIGYRGSTKSTDDNGNERYNVKSCGKDVAGLYTDMWVDMILVNDSTANSYYAYASLDGGKTYSFIISATTGLTGNLASIKFDANAYQVNSQAYIDDWSNVQVGSVSIPLADGTVKEFAAPAVAE